MKSERLVKVCDAALTNEIVKKQLNNQTIRNNLAITLHQLLSAHDSALFFARSRDSFRGFAHHQLLKLSNFAVMAAQSATVIAKKFTCRIQTHCNVEII
jgi:hypothetical protein